MAEPNYSIALDTKPPDAMKSLGSIMGMSQAAQTLQTGKLQQQRVQTELTQEKSNLEAQQAVGRAVKEHPEILDPETGMFDINKAVPILSAVDPESRFYRKAISQMTDHNVDSWKLKNEAQNFDVKTRDYVYSGLGGMATDPRGLTVDSVETGLSAMETPQTAKWVALARKNIDQLPKDTPAPILQAALQRARNMIMPMSAQTPQTAIVQTADAAGNRVQQPVQTNVGYGPPGQPTGQAQPSVTPPGSAEQPSQDALGRPAVIQQAPSGQISYRAPNNDYKPLMSLPPGETAQTGQALMAKRNEVNQAALQVPEQHFNNQQITRLADVSPAGTGGERWAKVFSTIGLNYLPGDQAANFQQLGHFMSLQSQANAKAMGAGTDAARWIAEQATGSTSWDPKAIKRATHINDALSTGVDYFNRGMERAIKDPNNQNDIFAARDFQNKWSQTFDVNAMRLHNALQDGNKAEASEIVKEVGGKNSPGAKALAAKMRALDALIGQ